MTNAKKAGAQNIAACEKQDKQRKFIDQWKSMKTLFLKIIMIIIIIIIITGDDAKRQKDWNKS